MNDTPAAVERKYRRMLMARSGEERLKMGCSMHATARALAKAALRQNYPQARPAELKRLLFLHFYGTDFKPEQCDRIASALGKFRRPKSETQVTERPAAYRTKRGAKKKK